MLLIEQHLDRYRDLSSLEFVHRLENPGHFHQNDVRYPGASLRDVLFGGCDLRAIVASREANDDVGINCAHASYAGAAECPLGSLYPSCGRAHLPGTELSGRPASCTFLRVARRACPLLVPTR